MGGKAAAVVEMRRLNGNGGFIGAAAAAFIGGHDAAAVDDFAIGSKAHAAGRGKELPGVVDAHAFFGADEADFAGIHAAQRAGVDGHGGNR